MIYTPQVLLLHGALGNRKSFARIENLLNENFEIHSLDFSGHGEESIEEDDNFSIELFSKNVIDHLNKNKIERINIFGYSMGGYVALNMCISNPDRVEKVFTLGTKIFWTQEDAEKEIRMLDADKMIQKIPSFVDELQRRHTKTDWRIMLKKTAEMMINLGNNNLLSEGVLSAIQHIVRLGIGDKDSMAGVEDTINAYKYLPNAQLEVFPNMLHPLEKINNKKLAASVKDFFKE